MIQGHLNPHLPEEYLAVKQVGDHEWAFEYSRLTLEALDSLDEGIDLWHAGHNAEAEQAYRQLIRDFPEFIDAYHHLALLLDSNRKQEAFLIWQESVALSLSCLSENFFFGNDLLKWVILENRPFL